MLRVIARLLPGDDAVDFVREYTGYLADSDPAGRRRILRQLVWSAGKIALSTRLAARQRRRV
jgi:hypothetical protein